MAEIRDVSLKQNGSSSNVFTYPDSWRQEDAQQVISYIQANESTVFYDHGVSGNWRITPDGSTYYSLSWESENQFRLGE